MVLKVAPLPEDIRKLGVEGVNQIWRDAKLRGAGMKRAKTLVSAAEHSVGSKEAPEAARIELKNLLNDCFLQALFGQSCKTFLDIIASPNWTKLQSLDWQLSCQPHSHCRQYLVVTA